MDYSIKNIQTDCALTYLQLLLSSLLQSCPTTFVAGDLLCNHIVRLDHGILSSPGYKHFQHYFAEHRLYPENKVVKNKSTSKNNRSVIDARLLQSHFLLKPIARLNPVLPFSCKPSGLYSHSAYEDKY